MAARRLLASKQGLGFRLPGKKWGKPDPGKFKGNQILLAEISKNLSTNMQQASHPGPSLQL